MKSFFSNVKSPSPPFSLSSSCPLTITVHTSGDCESRQSLAGRGGSSVSSLCEEMAGDSLLYSMIRVWSRPVSCPLQGPHSLAYGKGGATRQCSHPPSLMDSCTDNSVIQVRS